MTNTYTNESYVLYQCGGTRPSANAVPGAKLFQIPLTSVTVPDTVPYAFLVGMPSALHFCIQSAACGTCSSPTTHP